MPKSKAEAINLSNLQALQRMRLENSEALQKKAIKSKKDVNQKKNIQLISKEDLKQAHTDSKSVKYGAQSGKQEKMYDSDDESILYDSENDLRSIYQNTNIHLFPTQHLHTQLKDDSPLEKIAYSANDNAVQDAAESVTEKKEANTVYRMLGSVSGVPSEAIQDGINNIAQAYQSVFGNTAANDNAAHVDSLLEAKAAEYQVDGALTQTVLAQSNEFANSPYSSGTAVPSQTTVDFSFVGLEAANDNFTGGSQLEVHVGNYHTNSAPIQETLIQSSEAVAGKYNPGNEGTATTVDFRLEAANDNRVQIDLPLEVQAADSVAAQSAFTQSTEVVAGAYNAGTEAPVDNPVGGSQLEVHVGNYVANSGPIQETLTQSTSVVLEGYHGLTDFVSQGIGTSIGLTASAAGTELAANDNIVQTGLEVVAYQADSASTQTVLNQSTEVADVPYSSGTAVASQTTADFSIAGTDVDFHAGTGYEKIAKQTAGTDSTVAGSYKAASTDALKDVVDSVVATEPTSRDSNLDAGLPNLEAISMGANVLELSPSKTDTGSRDVYNRNTAIVSGDTASANRSEYNDGFGFGDSSGYEQAISGFSAGSGKADSAIGYSSLVSDASPIEVDSFTNESDYIPSGELVSTALGDGGNTKKFNPNDLISELTIDESITTKDLTGGIYSCGCGPGCANYDASVAERQALGTSFENLHNQQRDPHKIPSTGSLTDKTIIDPSPSPLETLNPLNNGLKQDNYKQAEMPAIPFTPILNA